MFGEMLNADRVIEYVSISNLNMNISFTIIYTRINVRKADKMLLFL